jgi:hypothetical protein
MSGTTPIGVPDGNTYDNGTARNQFFFGMNVIYKF